MGEKTYYVMIQLAKWWSLGIDYQYCQCLFLSYPKDLSQVYDIQGLIRLLIRCPVRPSGRAMSCICNLIAGKDTPYTEVYGNEIKAKIGGWPTEHLPWIGRGFIVLRYLLLFFILSVRQPTPSVINVSPFCVYSSYEDICVSMVTKPESFAVLLRLSPPSCEPIKCI